SVKLRQQCVTSGTGADKMKCDKSVRNTIENRPVVVPLYQLRDPGLGIPMQMSDALACNWCGETERIVCKCLVHARRKFMEIRRIYPELCGYVLKQIGYKADSLFPRLGLANCCIISRAESSPSSSIRIRIRINSMKEDDR